MRRGVWLAAALALGLTGGTAARADYVVYYPSYGPLYSGPLVNNLGQWRQLNRGPVAVGQGRVGNYPIAGLNSPAIGKTEARRVSFRSGTPAAPGTAVRETREQERLTTRLETLMQDRPLVSGTVVRVGATAVSVRLEDGRSARNHRFDFDQVFFFRSGELATAKSAPNVLQAGDRVLVPQPENR